MALILAVEPDRRQAAQLSTLVRTRLNADLVLADTTEGALNAIGDRVPDLVLVPTLLSPQDDAALAGALRVIATAARVQMLTIPVLADAPPPPKRRGVLAKWRRGRAASPAPDGCDPAVFADQIAAYLAEAAAERTADAEHIERALSAAPSVTAPIDVPAPALSPAAASITELVEAPIAPPIEEPMAQAIEEIVAAPEPLFAVAAETIAAEIIGQPSPIADTIDAPAIESAPAAHSAPLMDRTEDVQADAPITYLIDEPIISPVAEAMAALVEDTTVEAMAPMIDVSADAPMIGVSADAPMAPAVEAPIAAPVEETIVLAVNEVIAVPVQELTAPAVEEPIAAAVEAPVEAAIEAPTVFAADEPIVLAAEAPIAPPVAAAIALPAEEPVTEPIAIAVEEPILAPIEEALALAPDEPFEQTIDTAVPAASVARPPLESTVVAEPVDEPAIYELSFADFAADALPLMQSVDALIAPVIDELVAAHIDTRPVVEPVAKAAAAGMPVVGPGAPPPVSVAPAAPVHPPPREEPAGDDYISQADLDLLYLKTAGAASAIEPWPAEPSAPAPLAAPPSAPAPPQPVRPEWVELVESLRLDVERLRAERAQPAPRARVIPSAPGQRTSGARTPHKTRATKAAHKLPRPIQDQWGLFDPEQCGFAALLSKLEEITAGTEDTSSSSSSLHQ